MDNQLIQIVETSGLDKTKSEVILDNFKGFLEQAREWESKAKKIIITDVSQTIEMEGAREARLALKKIRCDAENVRKQLKEQSKREGKAIDGIANIIKSVIVPLEEHLEKQEKFVENKEQEKKEKLYNDRVAKLEPYVEDVAYYNLKEMSDDGFEQLLKGSKSALEEQKKAEAKAEQDRLDAIEKEHLRRAKIENENKRLNAEAVKQAKRHAIDEAKREEKYEAEMVKERAAKIKRDKERKEIEARERKEREAKEALEQQERDRLAKIEVDKKATEEAGRQEELKPEKEKLFAYAESLKSIKAPEGISKAGLEIVRMAEEKLLIISQGIKGSIKDL